MSTFALLREHASCFFLHSHTIFKRTTLLVTGDPKLDRSDYFRLNVTPAHPHPGRSQAPHLPSTTNPTTTHHSHESFSLLSSQPLGQSYRSKFTRKSRFPLPGSQEALKNPPFRNPPFSELHSSAQLRLAPREPHHGSYTESTSRPRGQEPLRQAEHLEHKLECWT